MSDKVCIWCMQDCSAKPRQKDSQGRYLCQECVKPYLDAAKAKEPTHGEKARRNDASATAAAPGEMSTLLSRTVAKVSNTCPSCSRPMTSNSIICINCGYNTETGRQLRSRVSESKPTRRDRSTKKHGRDK